MCLKPEADDAAVLRDIRHRETMTTEERHTAVLRAAQQYETIRTNRLNVFRKSIVAHEAGNIEEWNRLKKKFESMGPDQGKVKDHLILAIMNIEPEGTGEIVRVEDVVYMIPNKGNYMAMIRVDLKEVTTLKQPEQSNQGN
jgi:DNA primase large subunit